MSWEQLPDEIRHIILQMTNEMNDILRARQFYSYILQILGYEGL